MCILTSLMTLGEHATAASAASLPALAASLPPFLSVRRRHTTCFRCLCRYSLYLLYWYKSTSTDADIACFRCLTASLLSRPAASYLHPQGTFGTEAVEERIRLCPPMKGREVNSAGEVTRSKNGCTGPGRWCSSGMYPYV